MKTKNFDTYRISYCNITDFRKSEATNLMEAEQAIGAIEPGEVYVFMSMGFNQIVFVLSNYDGIIDSRKWRLLQGEWDPKAIQTYAHNVGLHLKNVRAFVKCFKDRK